MGLFMAFSKIREMRFTYLITGCVCNTVLFKQKCLFVRMPFYDVCSLGLLFMIYDKYEETKFI